MFRRVLFRSFQPRKDAVYFGTGAAFSLVVTSAWKCSANGQVTRLLSLGDSLAVTLARDGSTVSAVPSIMGIIAPDSQGRLVAPVYLKNPSGQFVTVGVIQMTSQQAATQLVEITPTVDGPQFSYWVSASTDGSFTMYANNANNTSLQPEIVRYTKMPQGTSRSVLWSIGQLVEGEVIQAQQTIAVQINPLSGELDMIYQAGGNSRAVTFDGSTVTIRLKAEQATPPGNYNIVPFYFT